MTRRATISLYAGWVDDRNQKRIYFNSDTQSYEIYGSLREKFKQTRVSNEDKINVFPFP